MPELLVRRALGFVCRRFGRGPPRPLPGRVRSTDLLLKVREPVIEGGVCGRGWWLRFRALRAEAPDSRVGLLDFLKAAGRFLGPLVVVRVMDPDQATVCVAELILGRLGAYPQNLVGIARRRHLGEGTSRAQCRAMPIDML